MSAYLTAIDGYYTALQVIDSTIVVVETDDLTEMATVDTGLLADREVLIASIISKRTLLDELEAEQQEITQLLLDSTADINAAIIPESYWEENEQDVNNIYLNTVAAGNFDFTATQKQTLEEIAALCPLTGADAVYKARSLVYSYNPTATFDDETNCPTGYAYRLAKKDTARKASAVETVMLYPNPNSGILNVTLATRLEGPFLINIYNIIGQRVYVIETSSKELKIDLSSTAITSGLYLLEAVNVEGNYLAKSKFIYEKK